MVASTGGHGPAIQAVPRKGYHRAMAIGSLLVNIDVDDLEKAERFYTAALDLRVGRRLGDGAVELLGAEAPLYLLKKASGSRAFATDAAGSAARRAYGRHWTPVHLDFIVPQLDEAVLRVEAAGATREGAITEHAWGRMALLVDPFGHGFCLLELSARGYDAITTG
jgi:predicted enzyme related to lactoylglutathione lyase